MLNYEKIILEIKEFANNHVQINSVGNGDLWEVIERDKLQDFTYPLLWAQDSNFGTSQGKAFFSFQILALDQTLNGEVNENFVKSSMLEILFDFVSYFKQLKIYDINGERIYFTVTVENSGQTFTERFNDILTGGNLSIRFDTPLRFNKCKIPGI